MARGKTFATIRPVRRGLLALAAATLAAALGGAASANSCASACYDQHNQCRITTKGSPSCDAALTQCLRGCNKNDKK